MLFSWNYEGKFLQDYPKAGQGTITNWFCYAVRDGAKTPREVLSQVEYTVQRKMPVSDDYSLSNDDLATLLEHLTDPEAEDFAAFIIEREALPVDVREKLKAASGATYQQAYMAGQPPTEKQINYLKKLGCKETPTSKAHASQLIDACLRQKEAV